jgi:hypothetical protein
MTAASSPALAKTALLLTGGYEAAQAFGLRRFCVVAGSLPKVKEPSGGCKHTLIRSASCVGGLVLYDGLAVCHYLLRMNLKILSNNYGVASVAYW